MSTQAALVGQGSVCGFAEELHGTGTEPPQGVFQQTSCGTHIPKIIFCKVIPVPITTAESSGVA
jgi:hypothetical protein